MLNKSRAWEAPLPQTPTTSIASAPPTSGSSLLQLAALQAGRLRAIVIGVTQTPSIVEGEAPVGLLVVVEALHVVLAGSWGRLYGTVHLPGPPGPARPGLGRPSRYTSREAPHGLDPHPARQDTCTQKARYSLHMHE